MADDLTMSLLARQWRLARMQIVNWGTFCGYHDFPLDMDSSGADACPVVMITGESGTGKSTLFDAKTAVLQKYNVPFNAASNTVVRGRARSGSQRNLYSYVLGKQDDVYDEATGEERAARLRQTDTPQWSAIVLTFQDTQGALFAAARFYYLPAGGQEGDLKQYLLTTETDLDPRHLEHHLGKSVNKRLLEQVYPSATIHNTISGFLTTVYDHMGIGPDGDGDNAMKLHQRIQGGYPITDVDELFKELVIDEPTTYGFAAKALDAFDESESVWVQMDEVRRKIEALSGIRKAYANYDQSTNRLALIDSLAGGGHDALALWFATRRTEVLDRALHQAQQDAASLETEESGLRLRSNELRRELEALVREVSDKGGGSIDRLREDLVRCKTELRQRTIEQGHMCEVLDAAGRATPTTAQDYAALTTEAKAFRETYDASREELREQAVRLEIETRDARTRGERLQRDLDYYHAHPVNITPEMAQARAAMARALGVDEEELPYAAELMDMRDGEDEWRLAACIGYHGLATQMLVDNDRLDDLSVAINELKLGRRVSFRGVELRQRYVANPREGCLSSKMRVRDDSPFAPWIWAQLCDPVNDHECVDGPEQLGGDHAKIDREGQTRKGRRGAHGYNERSTLIIGFTNKLLVRQLEDELRDVRQKLIQLQEHARDIQERERLLEARNDAAKWLLQHEFEQVDVESMRTRRVELERELRRLEQDTTLRSLIERRDALQQTVDSLTGQIAVLARDHERLMDEQEDLKDQRARCNRQIEELRSAGLSVGAEQEACAIELAAKFEDAHLEGTDGGWRRLALSYDMVEKNARKEAATERSKAQRLQTIASSQLTDTFRAYHTTWLGEDDPTGIGVASYPDYLRMLEELEANHLNEPRDRWLRNLFVQTASSLVPLSDAFNKDLRDIHNRMRPINHIMERFDFGPDHGQLSIAVRDRHVLETSRLRSELSSWAAMATNTRDEDLTERRHRELRHFMERLRTELQRRARGTLNTKSLVRITVVAHYPTDAQRPDNTYSSLDAKSGGETQELIAFILGAALLFCLGRNAQGLPSFSPVFLDEAFVKADEHFTQRAIRALAGLGFQVIIAVPTSKVQAVEPIASQYVCITKNREGHSFIRPMARSSVHA